MAKISLDDKQFNSGVDKSERSFSNFGKKVTGVIAGLGITKLAKDTLKLGIDTLAMSETSGIAWETLLGSQEKSKKMLDDIAKFAATTPFEKMGVDNMAKQLHNAGFQGKDLFDQLTKFGDIGGAFGVQAASLEEMVRQYSQVKQAGVAYTEDLNILQDRGIPIYKAIAEELGINTSEVKKWASEGKISADIYQKALDNIANSVEGGMAKQSKSFTGMVSTFKDGLAELAAKLSEPIFDLLKQGLEFIQPKLDSFVKTLGEEGLVAALDGVSPILGDMARILGEVGQAVLDLGGFIADNIEPIGLFASTLGGALLALKGFTIIQSLAGIIGGAIGAITTFMGAVKGATLAQTLWNIAIMIGASPVIIIIAVIGALVGAFIYLWNTSDGFREFWINLWENIKTFCINAWEAIKQFFSETVPQIIENIVNWFQQLPGKFKAWFDGVIDKVVNWATQMKQKATETAKNFIDNVINWIQQLPGRIWTWLSNTIQKAQQWANDMGNKAKQAAKSMVDNVVNGIKDLPNKVMSTGKNIVQGLWNGISGAAGWLYGKVKGFATGILDNMKSALGIHSPSREAAKQVGKWLPPGIEDGMEKAMPDLDEFVQNSMYGMITPDTMNSKGLFSNGSTSQNNPTMIFNGPLLEVKTDGQMDRKTIDYLYEELAYRIQKDRFAVGIKG